MVTGANRETRRDELTELVQMKAIRRDKDYRELEKRRELE
jgi:hypothetical protein